MGVTAKMSYAASKVTENGKYYGGILATKASAAKTSVDTKLSDSERYVYAKERASQGFGTAKSYVSSGVSSLYSRLWGKKLIKPADPNNDDVSVELQEDV